MISGLCAHLINHTGVFRDLRVFQAFLTRHKKRRGIGHRVVQPQTIKVIAQVIMCGNVLLRLILGVSVHPMTQAFPEPYHLKPGKAVIDIVIVRVNNIHKGLQIRRRPPALQISFGKAKVAFADQTRKNIRVMHRNLSHGTGLRRVHPKQALIRQAEINAPPVQLLCQLERRRKITRKVLLTVQ